MRRNGFELMCSFEWQCLEGMPEVAVPLRTPGRRRLLLALHSCMLLCRPASRLGHRR